MIDTLIAGRLHGAPAERTTSAGKPFATCKVRVSLRDGGVLFINVIGFDRAAVTALLALSDGDSVALASTAATAAQGVTVTFHPLAGLFPLMSGHELEELTADIAAKPAAFHELIESMYPTLPRIELFARERRDGWDAWGNEYLSQREAVA